jgi:hypothetical protein
VAWQSHLAVEVSDSATAPETADVERATPSVVPVSDRRRRWRAATSAVAGAAAAALVFVGITLARHGPPPKLRVALMPTALAPGSGGQAKLRETSSGWEIKLDTHNLVRLDHGRYYEAWFEGPKGIVSVGTFHTGAKITLWSGVEADEYETLTVTVEQEDGNPASSLQRVLTASLKP